MQSRTLEPLMLGLWDWPESKAFMLDTCLTSKPCLRLPSTAVRRLAESRTWCREGV